MKNKDWLWGITLLSLGGMAHADGDGHNHEASVEPAPCGGSLRDAPPYKAELLTQGDEAKIFVFDAGLKRAVLAVETLKGRYRPPRQKKDVPVTFHLQRGANADDRCGTFYRATIAGIRKLHRYDLHVELPDSGKRVVADFGVDNIR